MLNWFRPRIEIQIVADALNNDPEGWEERYGILKYRRLNLEIENHDDAIFSLIEGCPVKRGGVLIRGSRYSWRIESAIDRWKKRRDNQALRRLIDDDHTQRVRRITEMRAALAREEAAHIAGLLETK